MYTTDFGSLFEQQEDYLAVASQINTEQKRQWFAKNLAHVGFLGLRLLKMHNKPSSDVIFYIKTSGLI